MTSCNTGLSRDVRERYISYKASSFSSKADLPLKRNEILNLEQLKKLSYQEQLPVVESLIHDHFGQKPDDIFCPLNLGTLHNIFFIKISNKEFVLKTTLKNLSYLAYDFLIEQWIQKTLEKKRLNVNSVLQINCDFNHYDFAFILSKRINDKVLAEVSCSERQDLAYNLGENLAILHSIKTRNFGLLNALKFEPKLCATGMLKSWAQYFYLNLDRHLQTCFSHHLISKKLTDDLIHIFQTSELEFSEIKPSLLHGDLGNNNIFIKPDRSILMIDWEDALSGDPLFDIALWGTFIGNQEFLPQLLSGYQSIRSLSNNYMYWYWIYSLRILLSKTTLRYRFGYYKTDKIPHEQRFLFPLQQLRKLS